VREAKCELSSIVCGLWYHAEVVISVEGVIDSILSDS